MGLAREEVGTVNIIIDGPTAFASGLAPTGIRVERRIYIR
ncbi:hypothetical protein SAMN04487857_11253 [Pseudomonas sp. ok272]|nr:hypothetical protein SAMN04487857_11253 [Pseudomonas sp. ok272]SFN15012.1 hypothetical protein SAMN04487858_11353 [Pseudomonas sp. ok602]